MKKQYLAGVATAALALAILDANGSANAQSVSDATVKALMARIEQLEREVKDLKQGQAQSSAEAKAALKQANQAKAQTTPAHVVKAGTEGTR